jgi:hypothetical protein
MAIRLTLLRTVDATEADTFGVSVVEDFAGIAVEDGDDGAGEVQREYG